MTDKISDERIDEMLAGLEGVTPGPYFQTGAPWFRDGTGVLAGSPDGNIGYLIADTDDGFAPRDEYERFPLGDKEKDAAHFTRCDPETIRALLLELRSYRTAANPLQAVADGVAAVQKRIEELGLVGVPLIDNMSNEEFAADRSGENPNAGTPAQAEIAVLKQANEALMRERANMIATHREQMERLKARTGAAEKERDALREALNQVGLDAEQKAWKDAAHD